MTEKINGQGFRPSDTAGTRRSETARPAGTQGQGRAAAADKSAAKGEKVSITQSGLLMSKLEEIVQSTAAVDSDRVAALKDSIASGRYEIDDRRTAERLLQLERGLR